MFTGIIEELGTIEEVISQGKGIRFRVHASTSSEELSISDSIAINGVCQTVVGKKKKSFDVEAVEETLKKSNLGQLSRGNKVNLELPLKINERLGGHFVLGHVDCVGIISSVERLSNSFLFTIEVADEFSKYIIPRGSIAVDGVSLTIAEVMNNSFIIAIIPHTFENTIFQFYTVNSKVNIEFDMIGKYIKRLMNKDSNGSEKQFLTEKHLRELGF
jgi:riboflavin synthase